MRVYIAGPMTGKPEFNFPAFFAAEDRLRDAGHDPFNPARRDIEEDGVDVTGTTGHEKLRDLATGFSMRRALDADTTYICLDAEAIYMLQGWEYSAGAHAEHALGKALGLTIWYESVGTETQ